MRRLFLAVSAICALGIPCATALAQTADEKEAFELFKAAQKDMDESRFEDALKKLDRAYKLFQMPQIQARQAECYEKMGELETALELYRQVKTDNPKLKGKVEKSIADLLYELNKSVELTVAPNVPDVDLTIDHMEKYKAPVTVKLTRGKHHFEFRKQGYAVYAEEKNVRGAASQTYKVAMQELTGKVLLLTDLDTFEGTIVRIDDKEISPAGTSPVPNRSGSIPLRVGRHDVLCMKEGMPPYVTSVLVGADEMVEVTCKMRKEGPSLQPWAWVAAGTGAAAVGVGTWMLISYFQDRKADSDNKYFVKSTKQYFGPTLIAVGLGAGVASYFLFRASAAPSPQGSVEPAAINIGVSPVPGGGFAAASFRF
jgi:hypothetical protein